MQKIPLGKELSLLHWLAAEIENENTWRCDEVQNILSYHVLIDASQTLTKSGTRKFTHIQIQYVISQPTTTLSQKATKKFTVAFWIKELWIEVWLRMFP